MQNLPNRIVPYQFEPRYNEEQLRERRRRHEQQGDVQQQNGVDGNGGRLGEREQELQNRLEGTTPVGDWCDCGHCRIPQKPRRKMCVCCTEQEAVHEKRGDMACVTNHEAFQAVCLTADVLKIVVNSMVDVRGYGLRLQDWTNRLYRLVAYRSYTYWIHGRLGRYNRRVIPACVVLMIRQTFPEENDDDYVSYKEAEEELQDAWDL